LAIAGGEKQETKVYKISAVIIVAVLINKILPATSFTFKKLNKMKPSLIRCYRRKLKPIHLLYSFYSFIVVIGMIYQLFLKNH
jgi:hypothetical protein